MGERGRRSRAAKKNHALSVGGLTTPNNTEVDLNKEKAPGFAAPGDYSHGQYVVNLHDYLPEVQSVPIMLGWARSSHRLHDGRCTSQDVYRVHTDGVVMSKPMEELPLGDGVGKKKESGRWRRGPCEVVNANVVE